MGYIFYKRQWLNVHLSTITSWLNVHPVERVSILRTQHFGAYILKATVIFML